MPLLRQPRTAASGVCHSQTPVVADSSFMSWFVYVPVPRSDKIQFRLAPLPFFAFSFYPPSVLQYPPHFNHPSSHPTLPFRGPLQCISQMYSGLSVFLIEQQHHMSCTCRPPSTTSSECECGTFSGMSCCVEYNVPRQAFACSRFPRGLRIPFGALAYLIILRSRFPRGEARLDWRPAIPFSYKKGPIRHCTSLPLPFPPDRSRPPLSRS